MTNPDSGEQPAVDPQTNVIQNNIGPLAATHHNMQTLSMPAPVSFAAAVPNQQLNVIDAFKTVQEILSLYSIATTCDFNDNGQSDIKDLMALGGALAHEFTVMQGIAMQASSILGKDWAQLRGKVQAAMPK